MDSIIDREASQAGGKLLEASACRGRGAGAALPGRRSFLGGILGAGAAALGALLSVPFVRFALHPVFAASADAAWSDLGPADEFASITEPVKRVLQIERLDGWRKTITKKSVYVTKGADGRVRVLSAVCPHLGCTVSWNESEKRFISPCHKGMFMPDGALVSGPPRRAMDELEWRVEGGHLKVRYQDFRPLVPTKEVIA